MRIAVIPARGGSKRIPGKNIKPFCGKPMIAWSIQSAFMCGLFDHIIVSTDDLEIAEIAKTLKAEVPFVRPVELADDYTGITEVLAHAVCWMKEQQWVIDGVCCISATAAFLQAEDIIKGWEAFKSGSWYYTFSVTEYASPIFRSFMKHPKGGVEMIFPEKNEMRSQDLPLVMHDAAQFYWGQPEAWIDQLNIFDHHSCPVNIPNFRVHDIDSLEDWRRAELMFNMLQQGE